jgi:hypothetical protein
MEQSQAHGGLAVGWQPAGAGVPRSTVGYTLTFRTERRQRSRNRRNGGASSRSRTDFIRSGVKLGHRAGWSEGPFSAGFRKFGHLQLRARSRRSLPPYPSRRSGSERRELDSPITLQGMYSVMARPTMSASAATALRIAATSSKPTSFAPCPPSSRPSRIAPGRSRGSSSSGTSWTAVPAAGARWTWSRLR